MSESRIRTLTEDDFDEQVNRDHLPILVDFWASWCAPCKALQPTLELLAEELEGEAVVARVNIDENGDLVNRFGIRSIPTLIVFKQGKVVDQLVGAAPKNEILRMVDKHLVREV